tara:strand:- start:666 stop:827 length:162 start_codon:yes stop_codon:yes gene_type:complete
LIEGKSAYTSSQSKDRKNARKFRKVRNDENNIFTFISRFKPENDNQLVQGSKY